MKEISSSVLPELCKEVQEYGKHIRDRFNRLYQ